MVHLITDEVRSVPRISSPKSLLFTSEVATRAAENTW